MFARRDTQRRPAHEIFQAGMLSGRVAAHVLTFALNILALTVSFYMLQLYDRVLPSSSERTLILITVVAIFALVIWGLLDMFRGWLIGRRAAYAARLLARRVISAVTERVDDPTVQVGASMRDIETIRAKAVSPSSTAAMDAPYAVIFFIILFWLHWALFLTALIGGIALVVQALMNDKMTSGPTATAFQKNAQAQRFADTAFAARDAVLAMGMAPTIANRFLQMDAAARDSQRMAADREATFASSGRFTRTLTQLALLGVGAILVLEHLTSSGAMVTSGILGARALLPIENAVSGWKFIIASRQATERLDKLLLSAGEGKERSQIPGLKGEIEVAGVTVVPPGSQTPTLKNVSVSIQPGEFIGIIGPSGSGKSTLARVIAGAWRPRVGVVRIGGVEVQALAMEDRARLVGYLPQEAQLTGGSVRDMIARLTDADMQAVTAAAHKAQAHEMIIQLPQAYDTDTGPAGMALSGGQRQRVALARALFGAPRILILDEPTNGLDSAGETALDEVLRELKASGVTIILVSHRVQQILSADRVVVMRDGQVAEIVGQAQIRERYIARPAQRRAGESA